MTFTGGFSYSLRGSSYDMWCFPTSVEDKTTWKRLSNSPRNATLLVDVSRIGNKRDLIKSLVHRVGVPILHCGVIFASIVQFDRAIRRSFIVKVAKIKHDIENLTSSVFRPRFSPYWQSSRLDPYHARVSAWLRERKDR